MQGLPGGLPGVLPGWMQGLPGPMPGFPGFPLVHIAAMLLQHLEGNEAAVDQHVSGSKDLVVPLVRALCQNLDPFPEFKDAKAAFDLLLQQTDNLTGFASAMASLLRAVLALPAERQQSVAPAVLSGLAERVMQLLPRLLQPGGAPGSADADAALHHHITCDGCGKEPLVGRRWKCTACPDFDLCGACYARRQELHAVDHEFQEVPAPCRVPWCLRGGKGWGWKGFGKGKGKGKGMKGWPHCWFGGVGTASSSPSSSCSSSSSSSSSSGGGDYKRCHKGHHRRSQRHRCNDDQHGKAQWKKDAEESKKRYKTQMKTIKTQMKSVKQAYKQEKNELKQQKKAWKQEQKSAKQEQKELQKQLKKAWKTGTAMPGVEEDERTLADAAPPAAPHAQGQPSAASPLQTLVEMGFDNIELNAQLLEAHGDNVQKVLEVLISLMDYGTME